MNFKLDLRLPGVRAGVVEDFALMPHAVRPVQTHSCNVAIIPKSGNMPSLNDSDAIICLQPLTTIGVRTADCVPIVIYAPDLRAVAAVHAGWRGSLGGIVDNVMSHLCRMGADPASLRAAFGPSICGNCYEISPELADDFIKSGFGNCFAAHRHLDLEAVNCVRLMRAGVLSENIVRNTVCTFQVPSLPSWRRSPTDQRLLTWISLTDSAD
ncbi:MAG: polyphenol oxidase family protein [Muribaculum sp.]|nr:polyphenol oxidase family protein [Muribaculum sp.]